MGIRTGLPIVRHALANTRIVLLTAVVVIPDYATMQWLVRAPSVEDVKLLKERLVDCLKWVFYLY